MRNRQCPVGALGIWVGPARSGDARFISAVDFRDGTTVVGRTVQNRTGRAVSISDRNRPVATLTDGDAVLELPSSRPLTFVVARRPIAPASSAYPLTMVLPAIAVVRPEMVGVDQRLASLRSGLSALPGDLNGMATVPLEAFRRQVADMLEHRGAVRTALDELLASAAQVLNANVDDLAEPLQEELHHLDTAYGQQLAALATLEEQLVEAVAAKRLADASVRAQHVAGRSASTAAEVEIWQPVDALADALHGLTT